MNPYLGCPDCSQLTSGRCWRHATETVVIGPAPQIRPVFVMDETTALRLERDRYKVALEAVRLRAGSAARNSESALRDVAKLAAEALAAQPGERG